MAVSYVKHVPALLLASALLASCAAGSSAPPTPNGLQQSRVHARPNACPCVYVANDISFGSGSVTVYPVGATGNVKPIQNISGSNTLLAGPIGITADESGKVYVANNSNYSVQVYAAGATGNVAPIQQISGDGTGLYQPHGVALDPVNGDIYVANYGVSSVTIYLPDANGDAAPIGTITGPNTGIDNPYGIALDASGNIYVATCGTTCSIHDAPPSVVVFAAGSVGNVAPMQTISGPRTRLFTPYGLALDSSSNIYAASSGNLLLGKPWGIKVYAAGANGDVRPIQAIRGKLNGPSGIALAGTGNMYVSNYLNSSITVYAAGANGPVAPIQTIKGPKTGLKSPSAIAVR